MGINNCPTCLEKQRKIDQLTEEVQRLRQALGREKRKAREGPFGSSTPSSKQPTKPNTEEKDEPGRPGARPGHKGNGRKRRPASDDSPVVDVPAETTGCPCCGGNLRDKGYEEREVLESRPVRVNRTVYRLHKQYCPTCRKTYKSKAPGVLPKSLFGNQLIANAVTMHYLNGIPMGRICEQTGVGAGSLVEIFHRISRLFDKVPDQLIEQYRQAPVKHADETGWRTNGKNGYAWLFATPQISIFQFGKSRSAKIPQAVFGQRQSPGVLVVDRYSAYNKMPCHIQYCYAHLLREVQQMEKDFPDSGEVKTFVSTVAPMLSLAMGLRTQNLTDKQFYRKARQLKKDIKAAMESPAQHLAIRKIQDIFTDHEERLYHWARDRRVPADNNLAERDLRPSVIARKTSFGSITDAGAKTRSVLTTVVQTMKKQNRDVTAALKAALDSMALEPHLDPFPLLFQKPAPDH
jgi:transposase